MWKCLNCGTKFEKPIKIWAGEVWMHKTDACPKCEIDDIEPLHLCDCEREYITDEQDRCDLCEQEINEAMQAARERIKNGRNVDYKTAMEDIVYWVEREA